MADHEYYTDKASQRYSRGIIPENCMNLHQIAKVSVLVCVTIVLSMCRPYSTLY